MNNDNVATLKGVWIIVECPHCHRPQTYNKWVGSKGEIYELFTTRPRECTYCNQGYDTPALVDRDAVIERKL